MEISEKDLNWIAGIVDGEGTIGLNKSKTSLVHRGFQWVPRITIDNTSEEMLKRVQSSISFGQIRRINEGIWGKQKPLYRYQLFSYKEMIDFLTLIKGSLTAKYRQAELLVEAMQLLLNYRGARLNPKRGEIRDLRLDTIWRQLRVLNAKRNKVTEAIDLLNSRLLYSKEQLKIDMKNFQDNYNPKWKQRTYNRERLRQWRIMNPEKYRTQLERAEQQRKLLGKKKISQDGLIQDAAINQ